MSGCMGSAREFTARPACARHGAAAAFPDEPQLRPTRNGERKTASSAVRGEEEAGGLGEGNQYKFTDLILFYHSNI